MEVTTRANPSGSVLASGWRRMKIHGIAVRMPAAGKAYIPGRTRSFIESSLAGLVAGSVFMTPQPRKEALRAEPGSPSTFSGSPPVGDGGQPPVGMAAGHLDGGPPKAHDAAWHDRP